MSKVPVRENPVVELSYLFMHVVGRLKGESRLLSSLFSVIPPQRKNSDTIRYDHFKVYIPVP
jgi:hypothetical protein